MNCEWVNLAERDVDVAEGEDKGKWVEDKGKKEKITF